MPLSARELIDAKEATGELLEALGLEAYIFEVEPAEGPWEVHIECAQGGGWQTVSIPVERERLLASQTSDNDRDALLREWSKRLSQCRHLPGSKPH